MPQRTFKWDKPDLVESVVWNMRQADLPRGEDRAILLRLYNGNPPFDDDKAEENNVLINRNDLEGPNLLMQARRQWNQAFLKPGNRFTVSLDSGPAIKRQEHSGIITREINRELSRSRYLVDQVRATGANALLYGPGPSAWKDRYSPIPSPLPVASLLVPSETDVDFDNLEYYAVFREMTPAQLYKLTHGPRVDPGWNMDLVDAQWAYVRDQLQKEPNATAYQYMPERIEELVKQDLGFWGSDAVPTIDYWDFYFRDDEDGNGWYRRIILDWGIGAEALKLSGRKPQSRNMTKDKPAFLYNSGSRKYADSLSEILHCQSADCSAYAPFKYHSQRSLGWMVWGVCDLQNRLFCKFNEAVFESLMWYFRTASNEDLRRLRKAEFFQWGVIPDGIRPMLANERYTPPIQLTELAFQKNKSLMMESASSFTQDFDKGSTGKEMTATETMARVNSINAMVSGMLTLAYTYEEFKYREIARRYCIKNSPNPSVRRFRLNCLKRGVPAEALDAARWDIAAERVLGAGNKTLEMAIAQGLMSIRKNLGADAQRRVDHIYIESLTDRADLAEDLAPVQQDKQTSDSVHDAQLATERLMKGLPLLLTDKMVPEDYVKAWLADMTLIVQRIQQTGNMATAEQLIGLQNMATYVGKFLQQMSTNPEDRERVRQYQTALGALTNLIKGFAQRLAQHMKAKQAGNGSAGDPKVVAEIQAELMKAQAKIKQMESSHAARTAQRQVSFDLEQQRRDRETDAEIARKNRQHDHDLLNDRLSSMTSLEE